MGSGQKKTGEMFYFLMKVSLKHIIIGKLVVFEDEKYETSHPKCIQFTLKLPTSVSC